MKYTDVSYSHVPEDSECVLNAVQLSKLIDEPDTTVRNWADKHQQYLYIKKINNRFVYTQASVDQFKFIKDLCRNKNFTHKQIAEHIKQHGFKYQSYDSGLVNPEDPLGFQALSSALALENKKQLQEFISSFIEYQQQENNRLVESIKSEVSLTTQETVENSMSSIEIKLQEQQQSNIKLTEQLEEMKKELALTKESNEKLEKNIGTQITEQTNKMQESLDKITTNQENRDIQISNNYKELLKQRKEEVEKNKEQEEKQSLFSRIFNKKK
ncbi:MerR family transcriptional regulator [Clostridium sp. M14]|uniref:MerR family transcriptional regulator n=1 Tax=Clostridium sp. M14 TaxID=2716311 RepID=UPI0013EECF34|nr:MerR family transcriptional regulator [Clostridium sp. M14]MBZ9693399.1 MerR family transcriptional regulator [Clostridium sp. M14]